MTTLYDTAGRAANVWDTSGALVFGDMGATPTDPTPTEPVSYTHLRAHET